MSLTVPRGHESQVDFLFRALNRNKLPQGMLFYGPPGIGKSTLARYLSAALFCKTPGPEGHPCGSCLHCRKVAANNHPDMLLVEPDGSQIKVATIRAVNDQVTFFPLEAKWRVFLVDQAEKMNERAQNAFLKTLEEPPAFAKFILLATSTTAFLNTILSRVQAIHFGPLSFTHLVKILEENGFDHQEARKRAASGRGSATHALALDLQERVEVRQELLELLSSDSPLENILDYAEATAKGLPKGATALGLQQWMATVNLLLRDLCVLANGGLAEHLHFPDLVDQYRQKSTASNSLERWNFVSRLMRLSRHNPNPRLTMESVLLGSDLNK